jgi:hypothetical protein
MVVIEPLNPWTCTGCGGPGSLLFMEGAEPLCMGCADLDHPVFLPAGDAALSRRARKASRLAAVVDRFSRSRKRYERQGILVEEGALEQAEAQCLADEEARARRRERDRHAAPTRTWCSRRGSPRRCGGCHGGRHGQRDRVFVQRARGEARARVRPDIDRILAAGRNPGDSAVGCQPDHAGQAHYGARKRKWASPGHAQPAALRAAHHPRPDAL